MDFLLIKLKASHGMLKFVMTLQKFEGRSTCVVLIARHYTQRN